MTRNKEQVFGGDLAARPVGQADMSTRATFITRTYVHLFGAIIAFTLIEVLLFTSGAADRIAEAFLGVSWLWVLGGFIVVSWLATHAAHTARSLAVQYAALGGFVLAEALIFVPLLYMAQKFAPGAIQSAAVVTMVGFTGLTIVAFMTRKDFSFLGGILRWALGCALLVIVAGVIFGFNLGMWFSVAMVALAGAAILYDTSKILRHYPEHLYVGAALELFTSVALMFWYVLRIFMSRD